MPLINVFPFTSQSASSLAFFVYPIVSSGTRVSETVCDPPHGKATSAVIYQTELFHQGLPGVYWVPSTVVGAGNTVAKKHTLVLVELTD